MMTREAMNEFIQRGFTVYMDGVCRHTNKDDDFEYIVIGQNNLAFVMRNQGNHDRRFFVVKLCETAKAIETANRLFVR